MDIPDFLCKQPDIFFFDKTRVTIYWANLEFNNFVIPKPGILCCQRKWYIWPAEWFVRDDQKFFFIWLSFQEPYRSKEAAMLAFKLMMHSDGWIK